MTKLTDLRSHLSRLSLNTFLEQTRSALVNVFPGVHTYLVSRMEKNRVPLCCSAITEPEMLRSGNWARPGPRMLGCTLGRLTE